MITLRGTKKKRKKERKSREDWFSRLTIHTQFKTEKQKTFGKEVIIFEERSQVWFVRFRFSYGSWSLKFVNHVSYLPVMFFISSSFHFHIKIKNKKKEVILLFMTFCFFSYFLNNKKNSSSSIFHTFFYVFWMYFVLPKPLQNSPKTTSAVTRRSFYAATAPPATAPPVTAAAPLRRHRCRFGLVDLTWVWSKVVVA